MLENIAKNLFAGIMSLYIGCAFESPKNLDNLVENSFYKQRVIIDENTNDWENSKKFDYVYTNGIEAKVIYKKTKKTKELLIAVVKDTNNLLISGTPKKEPINNDFSYLFFYGDTSFRELNFKYNGNNIKVIFNQDSSINYQYNNGEIKKLTEIFHPLVYRKLNNIDEDLSIPEHIIILWK